MVFIPRTIAALTPPVAALSPAPVSGGFLPSDLPECVLWYDPAPAFCFQERTGASATTPSGVGDPIGTIVDRSGNSIYGTGKSDSARTILRQDGNNNHYMEWDGVDDILGLSNNLGNATDIYIGLSVGLNSPNMFITHGTGLTPSGDPRGPLWANQFGSNGIMIGFGSPTVQANRVTVTTRGELIDAIENVPSVVTVRNGGGFGSTANPNIGGQSTFQPEMDLYAVVITESVTGAEAAQIEDYIAARMGITLP